MNHRCLLPASVNSVLHDSKGNSIGRTGFIESNRGLRQGDPLSPYLFTIAMEYFSFCLKEKVVQNLFMPAHKFEPIVSHLIYADDLMIFGRCSIQGAEALRSVFDKLEFFSGLSVNVLKTKIYFSDSASFKNEMVDILGFNVGSLPIKYLGVPLTSNYIHYHDCNELIHRIQQKLQAWDSKLLSFAGRAEMIQSVINPTVLYWLMVYQLPEHTLDKLNTLCADFFWGNSKHKMKWENLCKPKKEGGIGLKSFKDLKKATCLKLMWKFINEDSLWCNWMKSKYCNNKMFWNLREDNNASCTWKCILRLRSANEQYFRKMIVDGSTTSLWFEPWLNGKCLVDMLGVSRFQAVGHSNDKVQLIIRDGTLCSQLHPATREVHQMVENVELKTDRQHDYYAWHDGGGFTLHKAWDYVRQRASTVQWANTVWHNKNPMRLSFISFLAMKNRLSTRDRLFKHGIIEEKGCSLCNENEESIDHLFFECSYSKFIWSHLKKKLGMNPDYIGSMEYEANQIATVFHQKGQIKDVACAAYTNVLYHIWSERNSRVFSNRSVSKEVKLVLIEREIWFSVRGNGSKCNRSVVNEEFLRRWGIDLIDTG